MIPKLTFPLEALQLVPLYQDREALALLRAASSAPAALSKVCSAYHALFFPTPPPERPYTFASIVLSLDGKMAFPDNPQGPVVASANAIDRDGGLTDFWVLNVLRAHADAIIVGARTLQSEPEVICSCLDPDLVAERSALLGKTAPTPLNIIVSLDGSDVPCEHAIFAVPEIDTVIATSACGGAFLAQQYPEAAWLIGPFHAEEEINGEQVRRKIQAGLDAGQKVILMTGADEPDAAVLLYLLRQIGIEHLLVESPTYTWLLMRQRLLDEFFVNYSSLHIGGPITPGYAQAFTSQDHPHVQFLVVAMHHSSFLFTRQKLVYGLNI